MKSTRKLERLLDKVVGERDNIPLPELFAAAGVDAARGRAAVKSAIEHGYFGADAYIDNRTDTVIAFEGFMDFLAYLSMKHPERLRIDAAVLNSVVNLPKAVPFISRHPVIRTFFDNDEAGRKATADLIRLCPRSEVIDQSSFYSGHKDVNDYLTARIKDRTQKPSTQKNAPETKAVQALRNNLQALKAETAEIEPPRRKGVKI